MYDTFKQGKELKNKGGVKALHLTLPLPVLKEKSSNILCVHTKWTLSEWPPQHKHTHM